MAGVKISALPSLTSMTDDDLFVVVDSGVALTKNITRVNVLGTIEGNITTNANDIVQLEASASLFNTSIVELQATASDHESRITTLEGQPGGYWTGSGANITRYSDVYVEGTFYANEKHFYIDHPTIPDMKLIYGTLEGPENAVYIRGSLIGSNSIKLPKHWSKLVDTNSITANITPIGKHQKLYVKKITDTEIIIKKSLFSFGKIACCYTIYGERKDISKLKTEIYKK